MVSYLCFFAQATERFQAVYPTLKEVALVGSPGSRAMKQLALQISNFAFKAAGEGDVGSIWIVHSILFSYFSSHILNRVNGASVVAFVEN